MAKNHLSNTFVCPICNQCKPLGDLVKHIAYSGGKNHQHWRTNHGLPEEIPFGRVKQHCYLIGGYIVKEFSSERR